MILQQVHTLKTASFHHGMSYKIILLGITSWGLFSALREGIHWSLVPYYWEELGHWVLTDQNQKWKNFSRAEIVIFTIYKSFVMLAIDEWTSFHAWTQLITKMVWECVGSKRWEKIFIYFRFCSLIWISNNKQCADERWELTETIVVFYVHKNIQ